MFVFVSCLVYFPQVAPGGRLPLPLRWSRAEDIRLRPLLRRQPTISVNRALSDQVYIHIDTALSCLPIFTMRPQARDACRLSVLCSLIIMWLVLLPTAISPASFLRVCVSLTPRAHPSMSERYLSIVVSSFLVSSTPFSSSTTFHSYQSQKCLILEQTRNVFPPHILVSYHEVCG